MTRAIYRLPDGTLTLGRLPLRLAPGERVEIVGYTGEYRSYTAAPRALQPTLLELAAIGVFDVYFDDGYAPATGRDNGTARLPTKTPPVSVAALAARREGRG